MSLPLPSEYTDSARCRDVPYSAFCDDRYNTKYLEKLRDSLLIYSKPDSISSITGFYTSIEENRVDIFVIIQRSLYNRMTRKFHIDCRFEKNNWSEAPSLARIPSYMYDTGPRHVLPRAVEATRDVPIGERVAAPHDFAILIKREGEGNIWHCLMEIMSVTLTMDVLRMARDPATGEAFFTDADVPRTQVVILDDKQPGPFFDLWRMVAGKPTVHISRFRPVTDEEKSSPSLPSVWPAAATTLVVPLPGGSNPFWTGTFAAHAVEDSSLLRVFSRRVFRHVGVDMNVSRDPRVVVVTYVGRKWRRLTNESTFLRDLASLSDRLPIQVRKVYFAEMSLGDQLQVARDTDVLVGVHGAGLTHAMFMRPGSAVVEIRPPAVRDHRGFRNLATAMGHSYFGTVAIESVLPAVNPDRQGIESPPSGSDWHWNDVMHRNDLLLELVTAAIKGMLNKGARSFDAL